MRYPFLTRGHYAADGGGATGKDADPQKQPSDPDPDQQPPVDEKSFTQKDVDKIVADRLARQQRAYEAQQREAAAAAEQQKLEDQKQFEELARQRADEIKALKPQADRVKEYERSVGKLVDVMSADFPSHIQTLLAKLSLTDQLDWMAENIGTLKQAPAAASGRTNINAFDRGSRAPQQLSDEEYLNKKRASTQYN